MNHQFLSKISCRFSLGENVLLEIKTFLEASFSCSNCKRNRRTVIFRHIGARGICTPKGKCLGFPGILKALELQGENDAVFIISYNYTEFVDSKYKTTSKPVPTWARIQYIMTCPKCMEQKASSTQTNIGRPTKIVCGCGYILATEKSDPIGFELI